MKVTCVILMVVCFLIAGTTIYADQAWVNATPVNVSPQGTEIILQYKVTGSDTVYQCLLGSSSDTAFQNRALATALTAVSLGKTLFMFVDTAVNNDRVTQIALYN